MIPSYPTTRRGFLETATMATLATSLPCKIWAEGSGKRHNVLFIAVDDLRPQLGCYGESQIHSPNIDRLAGEGVVFDRAYCQMAICMSSRASLMSGYRPDKGEIYNKGPLYKHVPDALSLNKHFLANGYETLTMGKIYHHRSDEEQGWSREAYHPDGEWVGRGYLSEAANVMVEEYNRENPGARRKGLGPSFEAPDVPDEAYHDGMMARHAIEELNRVKDRPFFMAVGFKKPHLPFNAPKKYWDLYDASKIELADNPFLPKDAPDEAFTEWGELRGYVGMPKEGKMADDLARQLIHGYYACISYIDAQIGRVLDELDRLGLRGNTVVVLWGDHGWKLGEHSLWCKHTNFELDTRVPLIVSAPGMEGNGQSTEALTEFVDIYPTLCDLCGLAKPDHLEGTSFSPLLENPNLPWKRAAFSQYPRGDVMGYSMRTDRYRYTEWQKIESHELVATELYDHKEDPDENVNVAVVPENVELVKSLSGMLKAGYEGARP